MSMFKARINGREYSVDYYPDRIIDGRNESTAIHTFEYRGEKVTASTMSNAYDGIVRLIKAKEKTPKKRA